MVMYLMYPTAYTLGLPLLKINDFLINLSNISYLIMGMYLIFSEVFSKYIIELITKKCC